MKTKNQMLARDFAIQAGLTETEADEVVQETAIEIARHLPEYRCWTGTPRDWCAATNRFLR